LCLRCRLNGLDWSCLDDDRLVCSTLHLHSDHLKLWRSQLNLELKMVAQINNVLYSVSKSWLPNMCYCHGSILIMQMMSHECEHLKHHSHYTWYTVNPNNQN
jgi:hypothetical protein